MARPPLEIGEWGKVGYSWKGDRVRAYANYRFEDGTTKKIERWGDTEAEAERTLLKYFRSLRGQTDTLTRSSRFGAVADQWIKNIERDLRVSTWRRYQSILRCNVLPALGELRLYEVKPARVQAMIDKMRADGYSASTQVQARSVTRNILRLARMDGLVDDNAATDLNPIKQTNRRRVRAFDEEGLRDFLTKVDSDPHMRRSYLPDLLRFLFGTGCRIGEALGLRWRDVNLTDRPIQVTDEVFGDQTIPPYSVWINGNVVNVYGRLYRHDGKTDASEGAVPLPGFLHTLLLFRMPEDVEGDWPVFPGPRGGWRDPHVVWESVRGLRARIGYPDFKLHWGRKTVASALDRSGLSLRDIANQLRHSSTTVTKKHYVAPTLINPEATAIIDRLLGPTSADDERAE